MLSLVHLVTVLFVMVAVSRGDEETADSKLESKWFRGLGYRFSNSYYNSGFGYNSLSWLNNYAMFGNGLNCFGYSFFPSLYSPFLFAKVDGTNSVSRRAVTLDSDHLYPRSEEVVPCINAKGDIEHFVKLHCLRAANKLAEKKLPSASCGKCTLSFVTSESQIAPKQQIPASELEKSVEGILKACSSRNQVKHSGSPSGAKDVAMVLSKSDSDIAC